MNRFKEAIEFYEAEIKCWLDLPPDLQKFYAKDIERATLVIEALRHMASSAPTVNKIGTLEKGDSAMFTSYTGYGRNLPSGKYELFIKNQVKLCP